MVKCSCCTQNRDNEVERLGASNREIYDMVELPVKTERKGLVVLVCPMCDGDIVKNSKERRNA